MVLLLVFMQLTRDLFAIAKFLFERGKEQSRLLHFDGDLHSDLDPEI